MAGQAVSVKPLVKEYFQNYGRTPNQIYFNRTSLEFCNESWSKSNINDCDTHDGVKRTVALQCVNESSGHVTVALSEESVGYQVHIISGRFADEEKKVELALPPSDVFKSLKGIEIYANKEKTEEYQKTAPVAVATKMPLKVFHPVTVQGNVSIFEKEFECTAKLSGRVTTDVGECRIEDITKFFWQRLPQPFTIEQDHSLSWKVKGIAEFNLDREHHVH